MWIYVDMYVYIHTFREFKYDLWLFGAFAITVCSVTFGLCHSKCPNKSFKNKQVTQLYFHITALFPKCIWLLFSTSVHWKNSYVPFQT